MFTSRLAIAAAVVASLLCLSAGCRKGTPDTDRRTSSADGRRQQAAPDSPISDSPFGDAPETGSAGKGNSLPDRSQLLSQLGEEAQEAILAGETAFTEGDYESSVVYFQRAAELHPDNSDVLRALAEALTAAELYTRAAEIYERILAVDADDLVTLYNLGVVRTRLAEYHEAELAFRKLLRFDEGHLRALANLAAVYQLQGKLYDARRALQAYIKQDDESAEAHALLGEVLLQLHQPEEAMSHLLTASALDPNDLAIQLNLATAARLCGSYGWAATALQAAGKLSPDDPDIFASLGKVLITIHLNTGEQKFLDEALAAWRKSLRLDPDQPALREQLARYSPTGAWQTP